MRDYFYYFPKKPQKLHITTSQKDLLILLATGLTLKEIAQKSEKKLNNIKKRVQLLYIKFDVNSRRELINQAIKNNFISCKDVSKKFRKRFGKSKPEEKYINKNINLSDKELKLLILKSQNIKQSEQIKLLGLWSYYGLKQLEYHVCEKFECEKLIEAVFIAKNFGIL